MSRKRHIKAVSMIEYSFIIAVVIAALLAMQIYFKRAIAGRWRQTADTFGFGRQYQTSDLVIW